MGTSLIFLYNGIVVVTVLMLRILWWQGVVPRLLQDILDVFPRQDIFTPDDFAAYKEWPSIATLREQGFRIFFVSSTNYGEAMTSLIFPRGRDVCNWFEPSLKRIHGPPECTVHSRTGDVAFQTGSLIRSPSCEIQYGPLNCDFVWKNKNSPILDEVILPQVLECGLNAPCPDLLTPERAASAVWTWAAGHPGDGACTYLASSDGRWRSIRCEEAESVPLACRASLSQRKNQTVWALGIGDACPTGMLFDVPRHPKENFELKRLLEQSSWHRVLINLKAI